MNIPGHSCAPQTSVRACIRNIDSPRAFNKLADMLFRHLEGLLNYCRIKVRFGVIEAVNGNIKSLLRRGSRIQRSLLSAIKSSTDGRSPNRIRCHAQSRVEWAFLQILAQSRIVIALRVPVVSSDSHPIPGLRPAERPSSPPTAAVCHQCGGATDQSGALVYGP
jgi:hypothetical protein